MRAWNFERVFEAVTKTKIAPVTTLFVRECDLEYFHVDNAAPEKDKFTIGDESSINEVLGNKDECCQS